MPAYFVEVFCGPLQVEANTPEEAIGKFQDFILEGRFDLKVAAVLKDDPDNPDEGGFNSWDIGHDVAGMIQDATLAGTN